MAEKYFDTQRLQSATLTTPTLIHPQVRGSLTDPTAQSDIKLLRTVGTDSWLTMLYSATGATAGLLLNKNNVDQYTLYFTTAGQVQVKDWIGTGAPTRVVPFAMESGSVNIPSVANTTVSAEVSFRANIFTVSPMIQLTPYTSAPGNVQIGFTALSATGFTACLYRTGSAVTTTIHWTAVQMTPTTAAW